MIRYLSFESPFGPLFALARGERIAAVHFAGARHAPAISPGWVEDARHEALARCRRQLLEYFAARRSAFELPLEPMGTPFQQRVWREIAAIPYGATLTYAELARRCGVPSAPRAAGAATGRNPLSIVVPCHRVVGSGGQLTGYAGGTDRKARLLQLEREARREAA